MTPSVDAPDRCCVVPCLSRAEVRLGDMDVKSLFNIVEVMSDSLYGHSTRIRITCLGVEILSERMFYMVYVLNLDGKPLMPCSSVIARLLLEQGKVKVREKNTVHDSVAVQDRNRICSIYD